MRSYAKSRRSGGWQTGCAQYRARQDRPDSTIPVQRDGSPPSLHVKQALQIVPLDCRAKRVSEPAADRIEDLPRTLGIDLVRHLDGISEIRPGRCARAAERIAVEIVRPGPLLAFALIATHCLLQLVHHV